MGEMGEAGGGGGSGRRDEKVGWGGWREGGGVQMWRQCPGLRLFHLKAYECC